VEECRYITAEFVVGLRLENRSELSHQSDEYLGISARISDNAKYRPDKQRDFFLKRRRG
jgi:hypothetical protein